MQKNKKPIDILFAATSDYLPYAIVTAMSAIEMAMGRPVNVHFMYADIVKPISDTERQSYFDRAKNTLAGVGAKIFFYDITELMPMLDGQNIGMWGREVSLTHYFYLLAPIVLPKNISRAIYLDTDIIVNCDLSDVFNMKMGDKLLAMGEPRGFEEMGDDVSNSGFVMLNLDQWRKENTINTLLEFGKTVQDKQFCDQNLLYQYFTKSHPDRLMLVDKRYNIFPQLFPEMTCEEIKIMHFTGFYSHKPWLDATGRQRCSEYWWKYARQTAFYEMFLHKMIVAAVPVSHPVIKKKRKHRGLWWAPASYEILEIKRKNN
ncbi:MAG: hypothetical protein J6S80_01625 [Alphaproteobacteria bacterium]|nr:hypothetical protein [Alphaproteobacteria bacterium]